MNARELLTDAQAQNKISEEAFANIERWLTEPEFSSFVPAIEQLVQQENWKELEDAFYSKVTVGTGGIRGPLGPGPNRINIRTIGEAAQGLSQFIWDFGEEAAKKGVVIGYDARKQAKEFAQLSAEVFAANGIKSYLFDHLCATPEISFAVRHLGATAGVMITASHNPRTDNGFKFYWSDGGQVVPPHDSRFMDLVSGVTEIKRLPFEELVSAGKLELVGKEVDDAYFKKLTSLSIAKSRSANIVFSPMHGSGSTNVLPLLVDQGFTVVSVPEQSEPDETFPTAVGDLINPEFPEVMARAVKLAEERGADVAIVADPDADRAGVATKVSLQGNGMRLFSGDEVGAMLTHFILSQRKEQGTLPSDGLVIETYVTTSLIADIARSFGVKVVDDLLVGFKYIAEIIEKMPDASNFIFAAEQSLGYLAGDFVRDKDAAIAALYIAEMVSWLKDQGKTASDYLAEIQSQFGYYKNTLHTLEMKGRVGKENTAIIMKRMRATPPSELGGIHVAGIVDRLPEEKRSPEKYKVGVTGDQVTFLLSEDGRSRVTVRPSGTEPIVKFYIQYYMAADGKDYKEVVQEVERIEKAVAASMLEFSQTDLVTV